MSFADKVKTAILTAEAGAETGPARRYCAVLDELAKGLEALGIGARINGARDPRNWGLYLHAPYRPDGGSLMLNFFLDGDKIVVIGENRKTITSPEELERWLLDFMRMRAFLESIRALREQAEQPVEARLRVATGVTYAKGDVVVAVAPVDQQMLAEADVGTQVMLEVERVQFPGNASFFHPPAYRVLDSAGLVVNVDWTIRVGDKLCIKGRRLVSE